MALAISVMPWQYGIVYQILFSQTILPNVTVNQTNIGGKNINNAAQMLIKDLEQRPQHLLLKHQDQTFTMSEYDINGEYNINQTIQKAHQIGRNQSIINNIKTHLQIFNQPISIPLNFSYDEQALDSQTASIAAQINIQEIPASIQIIETPEGKQASVSASIPGKYLDEEQTKQQIVQAFETQQLDIITIPLQKTSMLANQTQISNVRRLAENIINKQIKLRHEDDEWIISDEEIVNFLNPDTQFDEPKIQTWIQQLAEVVNREPIEAIFEFDGSKVVEFKAAKPGITLDQDQTQQQIKDSIQTLASNLEPEYVLQLPVSEKQPQLTTEKVNDLGIKERIGKGESWFSHSIPGRIHNVAHSAEKIHGTLVAPGEIFSFVKTIGEISAATGYQSAYIIQNGQTVLGDGGGVCQTSTTLFRAVLDAGLEIVERYPHAYRVGYYEQNYDVGIDATIFVPSVDFKFRNDTNHHILIQTTVDKANTYALFEIYGTDDGRISTITDSKIWNQIAPPPDRYQDDPTLAPGVIKQVDWKAWGASVSFDWKVEKDGQVLHEKTFYSNYRPWQSVFLRGI